MYENGLVERRSSRYPLTVDGHTPWREIKRKSALDALDRAVNPERAGRPDCLPRAEGHAEPNEDEPEPAEPEVEPDEDFTREDFMRDLRKFIPGDEPTPEGEGR